MLIQSLRQQCMRFDFNFFNSLLGKLGTFSMGGRSFCNMQALDAQFFPVPFSPPWWEIV